MLPDTTSSPSWELPQKTISIREQNSAVAQEIESAHGLSKIISQILASRGFEPGSKLVEFISPSLKFGLKPPSELKGLQEAVALIVQTIKSRQSVFICSDFDVDGLSGAAQMTLFFRSFGIPLTVRVPNRFTEGYGLNYTIIQEAIDSKSSLLITIDFGTKNVEELALAKKNGIKTIVIDHHICDKTIPDVDAFINPNQEGCSFSSENLCASGLVWYVIASLKNHFPDTFEPKEFLDLACLGTICDMVPLTGINRVIATRGLEILSTSRKPGLRALVKKVSRKKELNAYDVSFGIGPRLNAAGRLEHGDIVLNLITTVDQKKAEKTADTLDKLNSQRQKTEVKVKDDAISKVLTLPTLPYGIVVWGTNYHTGVVGIVAQRLVEKFYRPSVVLGLEEDKKTLKGSVRGIKGVNVVEVLEKCSNFLIKFGGHHAAGGLSLDLEHIDAFTEKFDRACAELLAHETCNPNVMADAEVSFREVTYDLINQLKVFAPTGMGNATPVMLTKRVKVQSVAPVGNGRYKLMLTHDNVALAGFLWRQGDTISIKPGDLLDVAYKVAINTYNGSESIQLNIEAVCAFQG
jgi:single-stranded-DNA-specific exonuclease